MTSVGITATRKGMTDEQKGVLLGYLIQLHPDEAHHGDCVGGDEEFHGICNTLGVPVVIHPPKDDKHRAFCEGGVKRVEDPLDYLDRNKVIVNSVHFLFGCPKEHVEPKPARGQGTWSTIRYARRIDVPVRLVYPDGSVKWQ